jgi:hypothetical protein
MTEERLEALEKQAEEARKRGGQTMYLSPEETLDILAYVRARLEQDDT